MSSDHRTIGSPAETRRAIRYAWFVVSLMVLLCIASPLVVSPEVIGRLAPDCVWRSRFGHRCSCCGMTRAFTLIARGRFADAVKANRYSVIVYGVGVINSVCLVFYLLGSRVWRVRAISNSERRDNKCRF